MKQYVLFPLFLLFVNFKTLMAQQIAAISDIFPSNAIGIEFGGTKNDVEAMQDGIGVIVLTQTQILQEYTYIMQSIRNIERKYVVDYTTENVSSPTSIFDYILEYGKSDDIEALNSLKNRYLSLNEINNNVEIPAPLAEYRLDMCALSGTAGEIKDSGPYEFLATMYGSVEVSGGKICNAVDYQALDSTNYIRTDNKITRNGTQAITVMGWIYVYGDTGEWVNVWHLSPDDQKNTGNSRQPALWLASSNNNIFHIKNDGVANSNIGPDYSEGSITYNSWHHIAQVVTTRDIKFYIDGILTDSYTSSEDLLFNDGYFYIGDKWYLKNFKIDEVKIFNIALTDEQINAIYSRESNGLNWDGSERLCESCSGAM